MKIDEIARQGLLYDFYGQLLTERQRQVYELYHGENLSLAEIAEEIGISRQGVHDALKNGQRSLDGYENKLGLVRRFLVTEEAVGRIDAEIREMIDLLQEDGTSDIETEATADAAAKSGAEGKAETEATTNAGAAALIRRLEKIRSIIDQLEE